MHTTLKSSAAAKSLQLCLTLCDPIDGSPPGSPFPGILQARTLEWVAIFFSNAWKWKVKVKSLSRVWFLVTPWTAAHQAPQSMGFSRQEYWSGVPLPSSLKSSNIIYIYILKSSYIYIYNQTVVCVGLELAFGMTEETQCLRKFCFFFLNLSLMASLFQTDFFLELRPWLLALGSFLHSTNYEWSI